MANSFDLNEPVVPGKPSRRRVLVTGAAGRIGSYFAEHGHEKYQLRLTDLDFGEDEERMRSYGEVMSGELRDLAFLKRACEGIDTVVHLAGNPNPHASWPELLEPNLFGTYHTCVAARAAGCRRIIYASSIHAVSGYPPDVQVKTDEPVNPGDLYGVTKCFGEALGRYLSGQEGISFIALRIGAFQPLDTARDPHQAVFVDSFVSHRDLNQLIQRCVDADDHLRFAVFHGLSNNRFKPAGHLGCARAGRLRAGRRLRGAESRAGRVSPGGDGRRAQGKGRLCCVRTARGTEVKRARYWPRRRHR